MNKQKIIADLKKIHSRLRAKGTCLLYTSDAADDCSIV